MSTLVKLDGTEWTGTGELWLDPLGDRAARYDCTISIDGDTVHYRWSHDDKPHVGSIAIHPGGARFTDTFHSTDPMECDSVSGAWGVFQVHGTYGAAVRWGWRIALSVREPTDEIVLQMTNIAPWGEETRAVRMVARRSA